MGKKLIISSAGVALLLGITYQFVLHDLLSLTLGFGRTYNQISDYPYTCRRIRSPLLESCEDMVIDHEGRRLYAACSTVMGRKSWSPAGHKFNASARTLKDHISVLNLDTPGADGMYGLHTLSITGSYVPALASGSKNPIIDVLGVDIEVLSPTRLRFWMINHRPPVDAAGNLLDAAKYGANSTIEVFEHTRGSKILEHVQTIVSEAVFTPNNLVATGDGGVLITNDHDSSIPSLRRKLQLFLGGGNVAYCSLSPSSSACHIASPSNHTFAMANGITKAPNSHTIFVSSTMQGLVSVFDLTPAKTLRLRENINIGMCIDNLSVDEDGDVFIAGFPKILALLASMDQEAEVDLPSAVLRLRTASSSGSASASVGVGKEAAAGFVLDKVLEDIEGKVLPGSTVAVHDVRTGSYWMGGVGSTYLTVCHPIDR